MTRRAQQAVIAQRLRTDGGDGEGLSLAAIAREMGISISYASSLISDPTGEIDRARKRKYLKRCKTCKALTHGTYCQKHAGKGHAKKRTKWTREMVIEAIQEWEIEHGHPPTGRDWDRRDKLPDWAPTVGVVFRLFGKGGWNIAMEAAGFAPRPAQFPEWVVQEQSMAPVTPMGPEARERLSEERKAAYAEDPDAPQFRGLQEGWDLTLQRSERRQRRFQARQ